MTTATNVTVNGQPVEQYLSRQKSVEIQKFLADEMRGFRFAPTPLHFPFHQKRKQASRCR